MELKVDRLRPKFDPGFTVQATFWPFLYFWASAGWRWIFKMVTCGEIWGMSYQLICGEIWGMAYTLKRPIKSTIRRIEPWAPLVHFQTWASSKYLWVKDHILTNPLSYPTYIYMNTFCKSNCIVYYLFENVRRPSPFLTNIPTFLSLLFSLISTSVSSTSQNSLYKGPLSVEDESSLLASSDRVHM